MYLDPKKRCLFLYVAILACINQTFLGQSRTAAATTSTLQNYGWEPPERREVNAPSVAIDHTGRVLLSFIVRERNGLVTRNRPSLNLRIVRLLADGRSDLSLSLPTNEGGRSGIYLSDTDQIIARANEHLELLQEDNANPNNAVWKTLAPCATRCIIVQSPSRRTLQLYSADADPPVTVIHLSHEPVLIRCGKAHQLASSEDDIQNYPHSITDEFAYFHGGNAGTGPFAYRWPLCDYDHRIEMPLRTGGRWVVLSDNLFVVDTHLNRDGDKGVEVISADGHEKFRPTMLNHESAGGWSPIRSSRRGDRIAVDVVTRRGGNRTFDISSHVSARRIAVYDIEAGKEIASIPVNPKYKYRLEFDLSPDGHRLATLEDDMVKVVDLQ
jgi:hypothetical protein